MAGSIYKPGDNELTLLRKVLTRLNENLTIDLSSLETRLDALNASLSGLPNAMRNAYHSESFTWKPYLAADQYDPLTVMGGAHQIIGLTGHVRLEGITVHDTDGANLTIDFIAINTDELQATYTDGDALSLLDYKSYKGFIRVDSSRYVSFSEGGGASIAQVFDTSIPLDASQDIYIVPVSRSTGGYTGGNVVQVTAHFAVFGEV